MTPGETVELEGLSLTYQATAPDTDVRAAALNEIGNLLWSEESADVLFESVLDSLENVLGIQRAAIALFNDDELLAVEASRGEGLEINSTIALAVVETSAAILTSAAAVFAEDARLLRVQPARDLGLRLTPYHLPPGSCG